MVNRNIIQIDQAKCDGCGLCATACVEGAIQIRDGKAWLVSDTYCDGLGACLGKCPQGAITIVQREAEAFDEQAVKQHVSRANHAPMPSLPCGCPGTAVRSFAPVTVDRANVSEDSSPDGVASALSHWPVQLRLVPPGAPFLQDADLLLVADCVPFAMADFHQRLLRGRPVVIACPKLDDVEAHIEKLADIFRHSTVRSVTVVHMEVPCCTGLVRIARQAIALAGRPIELAEVTVNVFCKNHL